MSLAQLEYFVAVAETGAVSRAAMVLAVSQPPLTRQIKLLEQELGTALFERTSRGMVLRPEGRVFLDHARKILSQVEAAKVKMTELSQGRCRSAGATGPQ